MLLGFLLFFGSTYLILILSIFIKIEMLFNTFLPFLALSSRKEKGFSYLMIPSITIYNLLYTLNIS